ncbi:MAG: hypothetical protein IKA28_06045, partial [Tidjanibacter sp.]|nr:hypothetical protein [Tidjanibacter sp.]
FTHYATFLHKKQRSKGACRLFVSLQGPLRRAERDGQAQRSQSLRVPTGTPSVDFALQGVSGKRQAQRNQSLPPHFYFAGGFGPKVAFVVGV